MLKLTEIKTSNPVCPICGKAGVEEYDVCPVCEWQNDPIQFNWPTRAGGANRMSLNEARKAWAEGRKII